ncbi:MAG: hypothetical protein A2552_11655 [Sulfuricurvum sp. RIFOXYD2_FULL_44_160]|uniref:DUF1574 domain-containing protein n=1 Tax=Sulfuricurvum kujiense TaxID=148813 RepID=A0A2D3WGW6_9BACT|nr:MULTISPECIES: hypothetical protein [Sulfuricurvum]OHD91857.1 MAG: hypothetical protein A2517_08045 [Sulfuricurvum sp. RIFOXYD12_FULL_44_77]OHD95363.1 MAG: hypothetical protein A2552_11655 [Sulfuricurvum sp. RIFOXYD2_FULL_44_160]DAB37967.1 MAG TPA: hypothetical protein CFH83_08405 [Sulfuricurvum kujiense]
MKNKSFLINTFYILLVLFSLQITFNYFFDSYGFFRDNRNIIFAARAVASGEKIAGLENYDERIFQKKVFENFTEKPQCIVIGSSRSMMIESKMIQHNGKFFNHSVSGASLEDYISITGLYAKDNTLPTKIIFGIDPWTFNKNNDTKNWQSLNDSYSYMMTNITKKNTQLILPKKQNKYLQLINYENTKNNFLNFKHESNLKIIKNESIDKMIKRSDGSIVYPFDIRYQKDIFTLMAAKSYISGPVYCIEKFDKLSNIKLFEQLMSYLKSKNVEIMFFLPPYHPLVYQYLSSNKKYKNVLYTEKYLREYSQKNNIKIFGSYNPNKYNLNSTDFTDGMHGKSTVVTHILKVNK